jgi:HSP20 family protein
MLSLYRPFTSLLRDEFGDRDWSPFASAGRSASFSPAVDVVETNDAYVLKAELPGINPNDIALEVERDVLTLKGERKYENEEEREGYRRVERSYGSFVRSFVLPQGTNVDAIEAKAENGILTVSIPKVQAEAPRRLEIKGGGIVDKAKKIFSKSNDTKNKPAEPQSERPNA